MGQEESTANSGAVTEGRQGVSEQEQSSFVDIINAISSISGETIRLQVKAHSGLSPDLIKTLDALPPQQQSAAYKALLDYTQPGAFENMVKAILDQFIVSPRQPKSEKDILRKLERHSVHEERMQEQRYVDLLRTQSQSTGNTLGGSYAFPHSQLYKWLASEGRDVVQDTEELSASLLSNYVSAYIRLEEKYIQLLAAFTDTRRFPSPSQEDLAEFRSPQNTSVIDIPAFLMRGVAGEEPSPPLKPSLVSGSTMVRIEVDEDPLTVEQMGMLFSTLSTLATKYWLISQGRFADLIEFSKSHDERFIHEAQAVITRISYNSPLNFDIKLSATDVAQGITTTIDGIVQTGKRFKQMELATKTKEIELQQATQSFAEEMQRVRQQEAFEEEKRQLELARQQVVLERLRLEVEQQRLELFEARLDIRSKSTDHAFEIAHKVIDQLHPQADDATKRMLVQTYVGDILQLSGIAFTSVTVVDVGQAPPVDNKDKEQ